MPRSKAPACKSLISQSHSAARVRSMTSDRNRRRGPPSADPSRASVRLRAARARSRPQARTAGVRSDGGRDARVRPHWPGLAPNDRASRVASASSASRVRSAAVSQLSARSEPGSGTSSPLSRAMPAARQTSAAWPGSRPVIRARTCLR